jgi:hypothetical protein
VLLILFFYSYVVAAVLCTLLCSAMDACIIKKVIKCPLSSPSLSFSLQSLSLSLFLVIFFSHFQFLLVCFFLFTTIHILPLFLSFFLSLQLLSSSVTPHSGILCVVLLSFILQSPNRAPHVLIVGQPSQTNTKLHYTPST